MSVTWSGWSICSFSSVDERGDDQVTGRDSGDVGANLRHDADELMADRPDRVRALAAVVPQVRPTHAAQHDPDDRIRRRLDDRIGTVADLDYARSTEDGGFHELDSSVVCVIKKTSAQPG